MPQIYRGNTKFLNDLIRKNNGHLDDVSSVTDEISGKTYDVKSYNGQLSVAEAYEKLMGLTCNKNLHLARVEDNAIYIV